MFLWLILCSVLVAVCETDPIDLKVLNEFRDGLDNAYLLNWPVDGGKGEDPCGLPAWPHVYCSGNKVSQIQVQNLGLKGQLPQSFNQLTMLSNLGLQGNRFNSKLPTFKGLSRLEYAYLNGNEFDMIPLDFFDGLGSIRVIALDHNPLNASDGWLVPNEMQKMALLSNLSMVDCNLVGEVPEFLGALPSLSVLRLSYNHLTGVIPPSFANSALQLLWLNDQGGAGMSGSISVVTTMKSLTQLWLHGNRFTGVIPESIGALGSLKDLNLNRNQLVGTIPDSLANMELDKLDLDHNLLSGAVPKFKSRSFTYAFNSFCQTDPGLQCGSDVMALLSFLEAVKYPTDLVSGWSGNDPCNRPWLGLSCNLESEVSVINLQGLGLNGLISPSLAMLNSLVEIRLGGNHLSGSIPTKLTELKYLRLLDVTGNNLEPPLPEFSKTVRVLIDGNPARSNPLKGVKTYIIVGAVAMFSVFCLAVVLLVIYRVKKREEMESSTALVMQPRHASDQESIVEISIANTETGALPDALSNARSENSSVMENSHIISAGNVVISIQVLHNGSSKKSCKYGRRP
uniref:Leucine-rich repeat-containing N-terminal plant-type domain-containing protein n=1 Tax=Kalanchoe fedtschenkoi TaxID=63787 RepID=A0A7N0UXD4_KALFE